MSDAADYSKLLAQAEAGDPDAQYQLGAEFHARRKIDEAMEWIGRAAQNGHPGAQYSLGAFVLSGRVPLNSVSDRLKPLQAAASRGVIQAQRLMSIVSAWGLAGPEDWPTAVDFLFAAAQGGDAGAIREAAILQSMAAGDIRAGSELLSMAARRGDPLAVAWMPEGSSKSEPDWAIAQRDILGISDGHSIVSSSLCAAPKARVARSLFQDFECAYIRMRASKLVQPSQVVDETSGQAVQHPDRSSSTIAFWPTQDDLVIHRLTRRMAAAAEIPWRQGEILNVMRYEIGQQYKPHFDFFSESAASTPIYRDQGGQRIRTALVYLNADYQGGETCFIPANVRFKGATGDALIFDNVLSDGTPDRSSLHAGLAVTNGVKWLASKWFRKTNHW